MSPWAVRVALGAGLLYLMALGYSMAYTSYDFWGALVLIPVLLLITVPLVNRLFIGAERELYPIALAGLGAKIAAAFVYYWIAFDAYDGAADTVRYHAAGRRIGADIRDGNLGVLEAIPHSQGTPFIEELTGFLYAIFGSSELGGFVIFAWLSYWGSVFFVKAAVLAVPGLAKRAYAALVMLLPSIVLWSATIGKEAVMAFGLGIASYGAARLLTGSWGMSAIATTVFGTFVAGYVRPHFAALWIGAIVIALVIGTVTGGAGRGAMSRLGGVVFAVVALVALVVVAQITLRFLDPSGEDDEETGVGDRITSIFETTERNTTTGGSSFEPIEIRGPQDYPIAVFRTHTRPLITEARGLNDFFPASEMTVLFLIGAASWRRLANLPRMLLRSPYVVFAVIVLVGFGIAWASFGNLGLLVRQRSVVAPFLVLLLCLPVRQRDALRAPTDDRDVERATTSVLS